MLSLRVLAQLWCPGPAVGSSWGHCPASLSWPTAVTWAHSGGSFPSPHGPGDGGHRAGADGSARTGLRCHTGLGTCIFQPGAPRGEQPAPRSPLRPLHGSFRGRPTHACAGASGPSAQPGLGAAALLRGPQPRPLRRAPTPQRTSELPRDLKGPELRPRCPREGALTSAMEGERPPAGPRTPCVASGVRPAGSAWASSGRGDDGSGPRGRAGWEWAMDPGLGLSRPGAARPAPEQAKLMVPTPHWSSGSPSHRWQENHACVWASSQDHQLTT